MSGKKCCNTINLAKISVESLKKRQNLCEPQNKPTLEAKIPPSPRVVKQPQILVCKPRPVQFKHPGAPCLCPPCPVCTTFGDRVKNAVLLSLKLLGVATIGKMTIDEGLWSSPDLAAGIVNSLSDLMKKIQGEDAATAGKCVAGQGVCRLCVEEQFCAASGSSIGLSKVLDNFINLWNNIINMLFCSTIGFATNTRHDLETQLYYVLSGEAEKDRKKAKMQAEEEKKKMLKNSSHESDGVESSATAKKKTRSSHD